MTAIKQQPKVGFKHNLMDQCVTFFSYLGNNRHVHPVDLTYTEFSELMEMAYSVYCRIRLKMDLPVNLPIHRLCVKNDENKKNRFCIAISLYSDFAYYPPLPSPNEMELDALKNLLCNKGTIQDIEIIKKLAKKKGRPGIADLCDIFIEQEEG